MSVRAVAVAGPSASRGAVARARQSASVDAVLSWAAVPLGFALLLSRLWLTNRGWAGASALIVVFGTLGALSLAASPGERSLERAALPWWGVAAAGAAAVALAAVASTLPGPALPVPGGPVVLLVVVGAAVAEEAFFRRLLYGRLRRWGAAAAVAGSAVAFGLLHVPLHGTAALPVDLGAGLFLSWQRWASGTWAAPAATHALANLVVVLR
jgi:membrane protease YdiL (CAAX protease family)